FDLSPEALAIYRSRYAAKVREADAQVGRLVDYLKQRRLLDSTILIITADHGESFGEDDVITHAFGNKADRESQHRVPLLFVFPPSFQTRPRRIFALTSLA